MKNHAVIFLLVITIFSVPLTEATLESVERNVQKSTQEFNELSKNISIADISEAITSNDANALKDALREVMDLNKMVNTQVNTSIQLWNIYLDNVKVPTMDTYLLGQVINSIITAMRAITLRCSVDQSMILSIVKKNFNEDGFGNSGFGNAIDVRGSRIESRWKSLRQQE